MCAADLRQAETHFKFGENWASYANLVAETEIDAACDGLLRLVPRSDLTNSSLLDIGCGSGLHALAALRLGVKSVTAADIDPESVATAEALLGKHAAGKKWSVERLSVFEMDPETLGQFDIVYSWGVLHHTGDLMTALKRAAALVKPGGLFVFALYRRTYFDRFWVAEKHWYKNTSAHFQTLAQNVYIGLFRVACALRGASFQNYVEYYKTRGMDFRHDVHDWLGGYPYEPITALEVERLLTDIGFRNEREFGRSKMKSGVLGSGNDEYIYRNNVAVLSRLT